MANYPGGKNGSGTYQQIINEIPPHQIYSEWFAGSSGIYRNIIPGDIAILFEKDLSQYSNLVSEFSAAATVINIDTVRHVQLITSFFEILQLLGHSVFCYLDPPYPITSRSSQKLMYNCELSELDHIALLQGISSCSFPIAISTYPNNIYSNYLSNWRLKKFYSQTRSGRKMEYLYLNYGPTSQLHDYRYIGNDFRSRELLSKQKRNFISKFENLDPLLRESLKTYFNGTN